jgi:hypothetical protein
LNKIKNVKIIDELFELIFSYFPIKSNTADESTLSILRESMIDGIAKFETLAIPYLMPKLMESGDAAEVVLRMTNEEILHELIREFELNENNSIIEELIIMKIQSSKNFKNIIQIYSNNFQILSLFAKISPEILSEIVQFNFGRNFEFIELIEKSKFDEIDLPENIANILILENLRNFKFHILLKNIRNNSQLVSEFMNFNRNYSEIYLNSFKFFFEISMQIFEPIEDFVFSNLENFELIQIICVKLFESHRDYLGSIISELIELNSFEILILILSNNLELCEYFYSNFFGKLEIPPDSLLLTLIENLDSHRAEIIRKFVMENENFDLIPKIKLNHLKSQNFSNSIHKIRIESPAAFPTVFTVHWLSGAKGEAQSALSCIEDETIFCESIFGLFSEIEDENEIVNILIKFGNYEKFEILFEQFEPIRKIIPIILNKIQNEKLIILFYNYLQNEELDENKLKELISNNLNNLNNFHLIKLIIKFTLIYKKLISSLNLISNLISEIQNNSNNLITFSIIQFLSIIPELIPSGQLTPEIRRTVLSGLPRHHPKAVIRRQVHICLTQWTQK